MGIIMHKFLIASCLAVAALAAPEAEADAYYGSLAATWPATFGYGVQSTCYGCRGHFIGKERRIRRPHLRIRTRHCSPRWTRHFLRGQVSPGSPRTLPRQEDTTAMDTVTDTDTATTDKWEAFQLT